MNAHPNILIAEDELIIALAIEQMLLKAGYQVCAKVPTGEEAIEQARLNDPDLLLMDIRLAGGIDGIEATRKIREFSPTPVVFMSGYQDSSTRERASRLKPLAFIGKPLQLLDLQPLLAKLLGV